MLSFRFLYLLWAIAILSIVVGAALFGIGPEPRPAVGEIAQRYYNEYFHGRFVTDEELHPLYPLNKYWNKFRPTFRNIGWAIALSPLGAAVSLTVLAIIRAVGLGIAYTGGYLWGTSLNLLENRPRRKRRSGDRPVSERDVVWIPIGAVVGRLLGRRAAWRFRG